MWFRRFQVGICVGFEMDVGAKLAAETIQRATTRSFQDQDSRYPENKIAMQLTVHLVNNKYR